MDGTTIGAIFTAAVSACGDRPFLAVPANDARGYLPSGFEITYGEVGKCVDERAADQAGRLRQELNQSLKGFQELTLAAFARLRDGIDAQVRGFGERLDAGIKLIDERAAGIATKLNGDSRMVKMRSSGVQKSPAP
jgi:hypothetical protein